MTIKPLRILHVITNYAGAGGAEKMLSRVVESTPQCEHAIVALMGFSDLYQQTLMQCIQHEQLRWNLINSFSVIWQLKSLIDEIQPDVIQGWMYHGNVFASVASRLSRCKPPVAWGIRHSLDAPQEESVSTKVALKLSQWLSSWPDTVAYCAYSAQEKHEQLGFHAQRSVVIPNGVIIPDKISEREFNRIDTVVGFAGRYHQAKGFPYLVQTIALVQQKNPYIRFKLAGSGVSLEHAEFVALLEQYHVDLSRVELCGQVSNMPEFYQDIDVLLLTSITEGFPNVLVEAMAQGVACISTDVGDAKRIVDQAGFIVSRRDVEAMTKAVLQYASSPVAEKQALSMLAIELTQSRYQLSSVAAQYVEMWQQMKNRQIRNFA